MELNTTTDFKEWKKDNPQAFDPSNDKSKYRKMELQLPKLQPEQPKVYPIDCSKIESLDDVKKLLDVLGLAMTPNFAEENGLSHLIEVPEEQPTFIS